MIERYSTLAMRDIWSDGSRYGRWRRVELAALECQADSDDYAYVHNHPFPPTAEAIRYFEDLVGHDLIAFLKAWQVGADPDRWRLVHHGLTSSDVVDTALSVAMRDSAELIRVASIRLFNELWSHGNEHLRTIRVARTHGMPAEVSSWGLLIRDVAEAADRARRSLEHSRHQLPGCKMSGPVGTYAEHPPEFEAKVAHVLGLQPEGSATQVIGRDRIAGYASACVGILGVVERLAVDVRLAAARGQVAEGRAVTSSAMPQKRNPVLSEQLCGLARLARGLLAPIQADVALWEERDISHSSVERTALPDLMAVTEYALRAAAELVRGLRVDADAMMDEVQDEYVDLIKHWALCRLVEQGVDRWQAHSDLASVTDLEEASEMVRLAVPEPEWFLRNLLPAPTFAGRT